MNVTVEGFSTPFLLHTVRAVEDSSASGSVAMINSDVLEDLTLLNGGYAQRYGDRTGAEVDFRLREGSRERRLARVAVSGTSASLVLEGPIGGVRRGSWLLSARQSYLDLLLDHLYEEGEGVNFGFSDVQAKFVFDVTPAQHAELTLIAGRSKVEERRQDLDPSDFFTGRNASGIAVGTWRYTRPRSILTGRFLASLNRFTNQATDFTILDDGHDVQGAGRVDASITAAAGLQIDAGAQAEWTDEARLRQRFTQGRYRVVNDFGGRATRTGGFAQLRWTAGPLTIRGGAGVYRQYPDFDQVIGDLGQPDARAQRATQFDLGFEQRLGPSMRWQVTLYDREEEGFFRRPGAETRLVLGRVVRGSTSAPYRASLDGYARGVELLVQRKSTSGISGWFSYSFGRNRFSDRLTRESYWGDLDQRHTLNLYVFYRISDRTSVSVKLRAGSNVPAPGYYTQMGDDYFVSSSRNDVRLPIYSRVDLRGNRTFNWSRKRLTLFGEIMNVLNRDNVRFNPPGVNTSTGRVSGLFETMIPIVPSAGILIEF
jgi:hypothetical protein